MEENPSERFSYSILLHFRKNQQIRAFEWDREQICATAMKFQFATLIVESPLMSNRQYDLRAEDL